MSAKFSGIFFSLLLAILCLLEWNICKSFDSTKRLSLEPNNGPNVCNETITNVFTYEVTYTATRTIYVPQPCGWICSTLNCCDPPRPEVEYYIATRIETVTEHTIVYICCTGWSQNGTECSAATCEPLCQHGSCIADNQCSCSVGWKGVTCDTPCLGGTFGDKCTQACNCSDGAAGCDPETGVCQCSPGFTGTRCESVCDWSYGSWCSEACLCARETTDSCDPVTGQCICGPGYNGERCTNTCGINTSCLQTCDCSTHGTCNEYTGLCRCDIGYQGDRCDRQCDTGWYGSNCALECECENGAMCNHFNGSCSCPTGWIGQRCEEVCPEGYYGEKCLERCHCPSDSTCHLETGDCLCYPGLSGPKCDTPCSEFRYGINCLNDCDCVLNGTQICEPIDGNCSCTPFWTGEKCEVYDAANEGDKWFRFDGSPTGIAVFVVIIVGIVLMAVGVIICILRCKRNCVRRRYLKAEMDAAIADGQSERISASNIQGITSPGYTHSYDPDKIDVYFTKSCSDLYDTGHEEYSTDGEIHFKDDRGKSKLFSASVDQSRSKKRRTSRARSFVNPNFDPNDDTVANVTADGYADMRGSSVYSSRRSNTRQSLRGNDGGASAAQPSGSVSEYSTPRSTMTIYHSTHDIADAETLIEASERLKNFNETDSNPPPITSSGGDAVYENQFELGMEMSGDTETTYEELMSVDIAETFEKFRNSETSRNSDWEVVDDVNSNYEIVRGSHSHSAPVHDDDDTDDVYDVPMGPNCDDFVQSSDIGENLTKNHLIFDHPVVAEPSEVEGYMCYNKLEFSSKPSSYDASGSYDKLLNSARQSVECPYEDCTI